MVLQVTAGYYMLEEATTVYYPGPFYNQLLGVLLRRILVIFHFHCFSGGNLSYYLCPFQFCLCPIVRFMSRKTKTDIAAV